MRRSTRWLVLSIGCAAFAAVLTVVAPWLWIRTSHGHRTVEHVLTHILNERVPGVVSVGALSGDVLTGLRASDVVVRNPDGAIIGRAQSIAARWRPLRLLRRRELEEVFVERPVIALDRARWVTSADDGQPSRDVFVKRIVAHEGQATYKRMAFTCLSGTATLHSSSHLDVHGVSSRVAGAVLHAFGTVGWADQRTWVATHVAVDRPGRLHGAGALFYTPEYLEGDIDELTVGAVVATRWIGGRGPLRLHGRVEGVGTRVWSDLRAQQDQRSLHLRVSVDRARQEASIGARIGGARRPIRLRARVRHRPGTIVVSALHAAVGGSRLDGRGRLARRNLRMGLRLHLVPSEARLLGLEPAAPIDARLWAHGPRRALDVSGQAEMEAAQLSWRGRVDLSSRAGALRLFARAVQPARLVRGPPAMVVSGTVDVAGRVIAHALVGSVRLASGTIDVQGHRLSDVVADTPEARLGRDGELRFSRLSGFWKRRRFAASGVLRWNSQRIEVRDAVADFAGAHAQADARYQLAERQLLMHVAPLSLSRALVSRLLGRPFPRGWTGKAVLAGRRGDVTIGVEAKTIFGTLLVATHMLRTGTNIELQTVEARLGDSHLAGAVHYHAGHIDASLKELVLSPSLVHQLAPKLMPAWPIRLHGALAGQHVLGLRAELDAGPSTVRISGRLAARQFQLAAYLDNFDLTVLRPSTKRVRGTLELALSGRFDRGGVVGTLAVRDAHGAILDAPFYHGVADAQLDGRGFTLSRAVAQLPGAKVIAKGSGALGKGGRIEYGVVITNALAVRQLPKGLRTLIGINSILPGRSVAGAITKRPGQGFEVSYRVLPFGVAQLEFLFRVLTGRYSWSEMRLSGHH